MFSNEFLEKYIPGVNAKWTKNILNIEFRGVSGEIVIDKYNRLTYSPQRWAVETLAIGAAKNLFINYDDLDPGDVDLVIVGTTTASERSPSVACRVSEALGCPNAIAFDVAAACAGFGHALIIANSMIDAGASSMALIIGADTYSAITDWSDRNCVFFGDGAGAVVLTRGNSMLSSCLGADSRFLDVWHTDNNVWTMDGQAVFRLAVEGMVKAISDALAFAKFSIDDVDILIPHQPGIGILEETALRLGLPFEKVHTIMDKYANTAAASVPIALHDALEQGKIKRGDIVVLATVGAGWLWTASVLRWV